MAETNKLKILYVLDIMRKTDEQHPMNISQIAENLWATYDIVNVNEKVSHALMNF